MVYDVNRYDENDPELFMAHGTDDEILRSAEATEHTRLRFFGCEASLYPSREQITGLGMRKWTGKVYQS